MGEAQKQDKLKLKGILKTQPIPVVEPGANMPWSMLSEAETKIVSRTLEHIKTQDFSLQSLKYWIGYFTDLFDRNFINSRVGRIAVIYNSCSLSLKNRLAVLGLGDDANEESFSFVSLLQVITTIVHSPDSRDLAVMILYEGIKQSASESVQSFLEKIKDAGEEAYGSSSHWNMSQASLIVKKIVEGLESPELSKLAASIVIQIPFDWSHLCDSIKQFRTRIKAPQHQQSLHAIAMQPREKKRLKCYRCSADHLLKECRELQCRYCGQPHKHTECAKSGQKMFC